MTDSKTRTYSVPDMSCGHCVAAIQEAVQGVDGVESVEVDLDAKTVTVTGGDDAEVPAAIVEAGFDVR